MIHVAASLVWWLFPERLGSLESVTDPDPRLYKKAKGASAKLAYMGHVLVARTGFYP
jgi:hypothetical protein